MSRDEAIEILYDMRDEYNLFGDEKEATWYHVLSWAIKEMKAIEPERKTGRWIPVWQELPQDNRFVLVCNDDERIAVAQYIGHEIDSYYSWQIAYCPYDVDIWEDSEHGKIMAWAELPKPYREGEKDDKEGSTDVFERLRKRILR